MIQVRPSPLLEPIIRARMKKRARKAADRVDKELSYKQMPRPARSLQHFLYWLDAFRLLEAGGSAALLLASRNARSSLSSCSIARGGSELFRLPDWLFCVAATLGVSRFGGSRLTPGNCTIFTP